MWIEVHVYSGKANYETGKMRIKDILTTQKGQSQQKVN